MTTVTARGIIGDALTFGLNRLSPGETLDADLGAVCLAALNNICDEMNGVESYLFRETLSASTAITGAYGTLGVNWTGLASGVKILGATVRQGSSEDVPMHALTMAQYQSIGDKTVSEVPNFYAHDGGVLVYLFPVATAAVITLRTKVAVADFAQLDTAYTMPAGFKSAFSALLAERMASSLNAVSPLILQQAKSARQRLAAQVINPAILGVRERSSIFTG